MVVQLTPTPPVEPVDPLRVLDDLAFLEQATCNPAGPERTLLNNLVRTHGIATLGSQTLRHNARIVLQRHDAILSEASRVLLRRLSIAGHRHPAHREYTAATVLCRRDESFRLAAPETIANVALRTASDIVGMLEGLPQLQHHPDRVRLVKNITAVRELCGSLAFVPGDVVGGNVEESDEDAVMHGAMLPESGVPDEMIFQAINQASEVLVAAAGILADRAVVHIAHDQAVLAATDLHYAAIAIHPLIKLLGLLISMEVETWLQIRHFIERPAALQSNAFRKLPMTFAELKRIGTHPRFPKHEQDRLHWFNEALTEAMDHFDRWVSAHRGIVRKYTPGGSAGAEWLYTQATPLAEKRRLKKASSAREPASGGCPMGHGALDSNVAVPPPPAAGCPMGFGSPTAPQEPSAGSPPIGY